MHVHISMAGSMLSTLRAGGSYDVVDANDDSGCGCAYHTFLGTCVICAVDLVECYSYSDGCATKFHHLCSNKHEEDLYRNAYPTHPWPPHSTIDNPFTNPFESKYKLCPLCHPHPPTITCPSTNNNLVIELLDDDNDNDETVLPPPPAAATTITPTKRAATTAFGGSFRQAAPPSTKPRNNVLRDCYTITTEVSPAGKDKKRIVCKYCGLSKLVDKFNATIQTKHITLQCPGDLQALTDDIINAVTESTQKSKKTKKMGRLTAAVAGQFVGIEPLQNVRDSVKEAATQQYYETKKNPPPQQHPAKKKKKRHQQSLQDVGITEMSKKEAFEILMPHVITTVGRKGPLSRMIDPLFQAQMISNFPAIKNHLPLDVKTVFKEYVLKIDTKARAEMVDYISRLAGDVNVSVDGVTINRKSKQLYTVARGQFGVFYKYNDLGSLKHQTNAEVDDAVKVRLYFECCGVSTYLYCCK